MRGDNKIVSFFFFFLKQCFAILGKSLRFSEPQFFKGDNELCSVSSLEGLNEIKYKTYSHRSLDTHLGNHGKMGIMLLGMTQ